MSQMSLQKKDCLAAMAELEDKSVRLILTALPCPPGPLPSPQEIAPEGIQESLFVTAGWEELREEAWLSSMERFFARAARLLREDGAMVVFAPFLRSQTLLNLGQAQDLACGAAGIWHDRAAAGNRQSPSPESWLCFGHSPVTPGLPEFWETEGLSKKERQYGRHPQQKPEALMETFIARLTQPGELVLDPFMGSGTTGVAALRLGRDFVGAELKGSYYAIAKARIRGQTQEKPKVIDLFSGVGGLSLGFRQAGFDVVLACEKDPEIAQSYLLNHPDTQMLVGDLGTLDIPEVFTPYIGKIDVLLGGPPSQGFSRKGKAGQPQKDWDFLLGRFLEVAALVQPNYFVLEADPHLSTAEKGFFLRSLRRRFEALGYRINSAVLNAEDYGIPQSRRRAILLGKRSGHAPELPLETREPVTLWDAIGDLSFLQSGQGSEVQQYPELPASPYAKALRGDCPELRNHTATKHAPLALERLALIPPEGGREDLPEDHHTKTLFSGAWCRLRKDSPAVTITSRFDTPATGRFTHPHLDRTITVREAARIQSFPDDFTFCGSRSSQMKQVSSALPPKLAQAIAAVIQQDMQAEQK